MHFPLAIMNSTIEDYSVLTKNGQHHGYCNNQQSFRPKKLNQAQYLSTPIRSKTPRRYIYHKTRIPNPVAASRKLNQDSIEKRRNAPTRKSLFRTNTPSSLMMMHSSLVSSKFSVLSNQMMINTPIKDQITIINHKQESIQHQQSIFEPKSASTPIYREQKTSTPNRLNRTLLENALLKLSGSNPSDNYTVIPGVIYSYIISVQFNKY